MSEKTRQTRTEVLFPLERTIKSQEQRSPTTQVDQMDPNKDNDSCLAAPSSRGTVQMFELVTAEHATAKNGGSPTKSSPMDIQHLLKLMDICTCASAEKHTGVNCVTVSMGDVVFEHVPQCGEMVELTARPVIVGRTSLDIALTVLVEGEEGIRQVVCEAVFTYVTTKGPNGEKRFCPPLEDNSQKLNTSEQSKWEQTIATYRRALVQVEHQKKAKNTNTSDHATMEDRSSGFDLEISEVVLPAHQNHMGHTFGGVVMAWMAKAALVMASRKSKRTTGSLSIRSVLRVDFQCGSDVSDHLIFRPRITAIFDDGRSAEVEVRVSKRSISTGVETRMNVGYFYVSGCVITRGEKTDIADTPFRGKNNRRLQRLTSASEEIQMIVQEEASWRRRLLLARRRLLGGMGDAVEWHPALHDQAPLLTILSVLRLVRHDDPAVYWAPIAVPAVHKNTSSKVALSPPLIEWTSGESWGRNDTFVLRATGILKLEEQGDHSSLSSSSPLHRVFYALKDDRCTWDEACILMDVLETQNNNDTIFSDSTVSPPSTQIHWDVVEHVAKTPIQAVVGAVLNGENNPEISVPFCYLRAWKIDDDSEKDQEKDSLDQSSTTNIKHDSYKTAILASQSVVHSKASPESSMNKVLPSGWFLKELSSSNNGGGIVEVTYIVEHDLSRLRKIAVGMSDEVIVATMASMAQDWFNGLATHI